MKPQRQVFAAMDLTGIDGRLGRDGGIWENLLHVGLEHDGYRSARSVSFLPQLESGVNSDWLGASVKSVGANREVIWTLRRKDGNASAEVNVHTTSGLLLSDMYLSGVSERFWERGHYAAVALFDQVFFSNGTNTWVGRKGRVPSALSHLVDDVFYDRGYSFARIVHGDGFHSDAYPYMDGAFGAPVMAAHNGSLWYGGLRDDTILTYNSTLPDDIIEILGEDASQIGPTQFQANSRWVVWTDPNHPYVMSAANIKHVPLRGGITAMHSWKDTLFVFSKYDCWTMTGLTSAEYTWKPLAEVGCVDKRAICTTPYGVVFGSQAGVFLTDGQSVQKLSENIDHLYHSHVRPGGVTYHYNDFVIGLKEITAPKRGAFGDFAYNQSTEELLCLVDTIPQGPSDYDDYGGVLVYDFGRKGWTQYRTPGAQAVLPSDDVNVFVGNGGLFEMSDKSEDWTMTSIMVSKPLLGDFGNQRGRFTLNQVRLLWDHCADGGYVHLVPVEAEVETDGPVTVSAAQNESYYLNTADKVTTGLVGTLKVRNAGLYYQDIDAGSLRGRAFRIVIEHRGRWKLRGVELDYHPRQGVD